MYTTVVGMKTDLSGVLTVRMSFHFCFCNTSSYQYTVAVV